MTGWDEILDQYEAALDAHQRTVDDPGAGLGPDRVWSPPATPLPGAIPPEHRARATALLARTAELTRRASLVHQNLPPLPARRPHRSSGYGSNTPGYVDRRV